MAVQMEQYEVDMLLANIDDAELEEVEDPNLPTIPLRKVIVIPFQLTIPKVIWKRDSLKTYLYLIVTTYNNVNYFVRVPYSHKYAYSHYDIIKVSTWYVITFYLSDTWVKKHIDVFSNNKRAQNSTKE